MLKTTDRGGALVRREKGHKKVRARTRTLMCSFLIGSNQKPVACIMRRHASNRDSFDGDVDGDDGRERGRSRALSAWHAVARRGPIAPSREYHVRRQNHLHIQRPDRARGSTFDWDGHLSVTHDVVCVGRSRPRSVDGTTNSEGRASTSDDDSAFLG